MSTKKIIRGALQSLEQTSNLLKNINLETYVFVPTPYLFSTIGEHTRHLLDLYQNLITSFDKPQGERCPIDYDCRERGSLVEKDRQAGIQSLDKISHWLKSLATRAEAIENSKIYIKTEVLLSETDSVLIPSNLSRELCFVASHNTHHLAIMGMIARVAGIAIDPNYGIAPTTASYIRIKTESKKEKAL